MESLVVVVVVVVEWCFQSSIWAATATLWPPYHSSFVIFRLPHLEIPSIFHEPFSSFQPLFSRFLCSIRANGIADDASQSQVGQLGLLPCGRPHADYQATSQCPPLAGTFLSVFLIVFAASYHFFTIHLPPLSAPSRTSSPTSRKARTARHTLFSEMFKVRAICAVSCSGFSEKAASTRRALARKSFL